jgi:hypothetical protein
MNIIQQQDNLKSLPEEVLIRYIENPMGEAPTFLVLGELERRKVMKDKYAAQQAERPPISEQIIAESMTEIMPRPMDMVGGLGRSNRQEALRRETAPQMAQGIATPMAPPMAPQEAGIAANPAPNVGQNYNAGGIVGFAAGDYVDRFAGYSDSIPGYQDAYNETSTAFQKDPRSSLFYKDQQKTLDEKLAELDTDSEKALYMSLIKGGAKAAQSTSPYFASALGEGVETGADTYGKMTTATKAKRDLLDTEKRGIDRAQYADVNKRTGDFFTEMRELDKNEAARGAKRAVNQGKIDVATMNLMSEHIRAAEKIAQTNLTNKPSQIPGTSAADKQAWVIETGRLNGMQSAVKALRATQTWDAEQEKAMWATIGITPDKNSSIEDVIRARYEEIDARALTLPAIESRLAESLLGKITPSIQEVQRLARADKKAYPDTLEFANPKTGKKMSLGEIRRKLGL